MVKTELDLPNKLFLKYKRKFIRMLGTKALTNHQIEAICSKEFKNWRKHILFLI